MAHQTAQLLTRETPDFIATTLWPANSPDINPVDYWIWGKLQKRLYCSQLYRRPAEVASDRRVGTFQPDDQLIINEAVRQ